MKRDLIIQAIGDKIKDNLFELDDNWDYEADEFGREASCRTSFQFEYGNGMCEVEASVTWPYNKSSTLEVLIYGTEGHVENTFKDLSNIEKAVTAYLDEHLDDGDLLDAIVDAVRDCYEDEWQSHGFRDAADYYSWRYG